MGIPSALVPTTSRPPLSQFQNRRVSLSLRHSVKYTLGSITFHRRSCSNNNFVSLTTTTSKLPLFSNQQPPLQIIRQRQRPTHPSLRPILCSSTTTTNASSNSDSSENPLLSAIKGLPFFDSLSPVLTSLRNPTPLTICKLSLLAAVIISLTKFTVSTLLNPFFWMYFSWTWLFWPWYVLILITLCLIHTYRKYTSGTATAADQIGLVASAITHLTLIPPAMFNGYLEGWPVAFFCVYHYFFYLNVSVRKRLYGDLYMRPHDPEWDIALPKLHTALFCAAVFIGHWLAAFEAPELIRLAGGGWKINAAIWVLIIFAMFTHYHGTLYLAKYSEKVVVPQTVVIFGPYRWVRHPIYTSVMMLFVAYFAALRAPLSAVYIVAVCLVYYNHKAELEEKILLKRSGPLYPDYIKRVRYRFIPFVW